MMKIRICFDFGSRMTVFPGPPLDAARDKGQKAG